MITISSLGLLALKSVLIVALAWLAHLSTRHQPAKVRYFSLQVFFFALAFLPLGTYLLPKWHLNIKSSISQQVNPPAASYLLAERPGKKTEVVAQEISCTDAQQRSVIEDVHTIEAIQTHPVSADESWSIVLYWVWLLGSILLLGHLIWELRLLRKFRSSTSAADQHPMIDKLWFSLAPTHQLPTPQFILDSSVQVPFTFGYRKPVIVLPHNAIEWPVEQLKTVLLHEAAHIRNGDHLPNIIRRLACCFFWWNYPIWILARKVQLESEKRADQWVVHQEISPYDYAAQLVQITRLLQTPKYTLVSSISHANQLRNRVEHVLNADHEVQAKFGFSSKLVLLVLGLFTVLSACFQTGTADTQSLHTAIQQHMHGSVDQLVPLIWQAGDEENRATVPALKQLLQHDSTQVRSLAAWALGEIKDTSSFRALSKLLKDPDTWVQEMAIRSIGELEIPRSLDLIQAFLDSPQPHLRLSAVQAIADIGIPKGITILWKSIQQWPQDQQTAAIKRIGEYGNYCAVPLLSSIILEESISSLDAIVGLGKLRSKESLATLLPLLSHENPQMRAATARSLGMIGDVKAIHFLIPLLRDENSEVREVTVWALDEIRA